MTNIQYLTGLLVFQSLLLLYLFVDCIIKKEIDIIDKFFIYLLTITISLTSIVF